MNNRILSFWALAIGTLALDQGVKAWVRANLVEGQFWQGGPIPGYFELTLTFNKGIAFGMFKGFAVLMAPIAVVIAYMAARHIHKHSKEGIKNDGVPGVIAMSLLFSGAIGNLIDRLFDPRGVTDMFLIRLANITEKWPFHLPDFPVFNVADACITVAMIFLAWTWLREGKEAESGVTETKDEAPEEVPEPRAESV